VRRLPTYALSASLLLGCGDEGARHERTIAWALGGKPVIADLHMHTRHSDGALAPSELVERAVVNGCQVIALTDHSDPKLKSVDAEFFAALDELRRKLPDRVLLAGLEWNLPPHGGTQHVNLLVAPEVERTVLQQFKAQFDAAVVNASAQQAITWLADTVKEPDQRVLIYNHPLRHPAISPETVASELAAWPRAGSIIAGFEGSPGHQRSERIGAYHTSRPTFERWDRAAAEVGGLWDGLLGRGIDTWGAIASSDYHNDQWDHEPCAFSQTVMQVPELTASGVLRAIRAGTFWGGHGRVLRQLAFTVNAPGLTVPASPGELIRYRKQGTLTVRVSVDRTASQANAVLSVEVIGNCREGVPQSIAKADLPAGSNEAEWTLTDLRVGEDKSTCYLRARVRASGGANEGLTAYTNSIRIRLD
jgi:hypothetical protein